MLSTACQWGERERFERPCGLASGDHVGETEKFKQHRAGILALTSLRLVPKTIRHPPRRGQETGRGTRRFGGIGVDGRSSAPTRANHILEVERSPCPPRGHREHVVGKGVETGERTRTRAARRVHRLPNLEPTVTARYDESHTHYVTTSPTH
jgi:hypothetical protein